MVLLEPCLLKTAEAQRALLLVSLVCFKKPAVGRFCRYYLISFIYFLSSPFAFTEMPTV